MKLHFGHLVGATAIIIAACAAFFSVFGISQLFAGAFWAVVVMASALEFGKLVMASNLQKRWKNSGKVRRIYGTIIVVFLMIITSAGIYGLLSSAYQKTYTDYTIMENQVSFLQQKEGFFQSDVDRYDKDIAQINDNISTLSGAKVSNIQVRDTSSSTGVRNTISTAELRAAQSRIAIEETNKRELQAKRITAIDSLNSYKTQILTLQNNTDISSELGPLIYLKELTGLPMDKVVNFFIILLVFVFDPMAILLVLEANKIFEEKREEKYNKELAERFKRAPQPIDPLPNYNIDLHAKNTTIEAIEAKFGQSPATPNAFIPEDKDKNIDAEAELTEYLNKEMAKEMQEEEDRRKINPITGEDDLKYNEQDLMKDIYPTQRSSDNEPTVENTPPPAPVYPTAAPRPEIPQDEKPIAKSGIVKPATNVGTTKIQPVITTGSVEREDIKEIRQGAKRGFKKPIPRRRGN
jgi:hypothetical protein